MLTGKVQLFDLSSDQQEGRNLAESSPLQVAEAIAYMDEAHRSDPNWPIPQKKK